MPLATVIAKYVNEPQQGRKNGSIKSETGEYYGVPPAMLSQFTPGSTYEIEYGERIYNKQTYKDVKSARLIGAPTPTAAAPAPQGGGGYYRPTDDATAERIFVCGALNAAISAGQVHVMDLALLTGAVGNLRKAWMLMKPVTQPVTQPAQQARPVQATQQRSNDDMDDSIPF